jgi:hypothetical protein
MCLFKACLSTCPSRACTTGRSRLGKLNVSISNGVALVSFFDVPCARNVVVQSRKAGFVASECAPPPTLNAWERPTSDCVVDFTTQLHSYQHMADYLTSRHGKHISWMSRSQSSSLRFQFKNSAVALMARNERYQVPGLHARSCFAVISEAWILQSNQLAAFLMRRESNFKWQYSVYDNRAKRNVALEQQPKQVGAKFICAGETCCGTLPTTMAYLSVEHKLNISAPARAARKALRRAT